MWFFMISCYVLTFLSFVLLVLSGLQGYFFFYILNANHATFALLTIIIYLFTETLIMFFFVGIGVSVKEYIQEHKSHPQYHQRSLAIKRKLYPPMLLNMVMVMILFISGGAVDTKHLSPWLHGGLFYLCLIHFMKVIKIQHECFKESTEIVLRMSGVITTLKSEI